MSKMMAVKEETLSELRSHKVHPRESDSDALAKILLKVKEIEPTAEPTQEPEPTYPEQ
jgi:negative regulator of replication initiation|tara:strand:+ start:260 stop:433 length:174 start_codon:yes stop_codon:yes gene_type:complete